MPSEIKGILRPCDRMTMTHVSEITITIDDVEIPLKKLSFREPCSHPGCMSHVSHPCEGCGRIVGTLKEPDAPNP